MSPEQQALIRKAQQSLEAARLLAGGGFHDFAVARAYYTMLYVAQALLLGKGLSYSKHSGGSLRPTLRQARTRTFRVPP